MKHVFTGLA